MSSKNGTVFGGSLLVAGTAIGGGILALPVLTAMGGFWPAVAIYAACWLFMAGTGMLFVDLFLWSPTEVNLVSMARMTLGKWGKIVAWILYLYLFASLTVAYLSGGGEIISTVLHLSPRLGPVIFALLFAPFIWIGPWLVDRLNWFLMLALMVTFFVFVATGIWRISPELLTYHHATNALLATPVVFTSFGFQGLIPTLTNYLGRRRNATYLAIIIGSLIPLFVYILWEALILGLVPLPLLEQAKALGYTAVTPLKEALQTPWLYSVGQAFAFLTITTSFLGVGIALLDFLADGFKIQKTGMTRLWLTLLIVVPPLFFAVNNPCLFLNALHYGGGLGCALLLGLLPILMVLSGRKRFQSTFPLWILLLMLLFILLVLTVMFIQS